MNNRLLLDCTLRDGGYVNDWKFGLSNIINIFERVVDSKVDVIEIGFLDERRGFDIDRSIMPNTESIDKIFGKLDKKDTMVVAMIDYGTCGIENIKPCSESFIDGIRVIFKKHLREPAMKFCKQLSDLGYKVFAQLVSITSYTDEELLDLVRLANDIVPYAVSMVDTYGLMHHKQLRHYFDILEKNMDKRICIGYHGHNNFQMAYSNCIDFLESDVDRTLLVDGTIYGMGKSAGNAPIELLAMNMNEDYGTNYNIYQMLEAIDSSILSFYSPASWGYNLFFYLSAANKCHPTYVSDLVKKKTLSVKSISEILSRLEGDRRLLYNKDYIEKLYIDYQKNDINDKNAIEELKKEFGHRNVLILGSGDSIAKQKDLVDICIEKYNPIIISLNYFSKVIDSDYLFLSNSKKYVAVASEIKEKANKKIIATSNVTRTSGEFDYTLNYGSLIDETCRENADIAFIMLLKTLIKINVENVFLTGIDGFNSQHDGVYLDSNIDLGFKQTTSDDWNEYVNMKIHELRQFINIKFVTDTIYDIS